MSRSTRPPSSTSTHGCPGHLERVGHPYVNEPIYTPAKLHVDAWVSYAFKMAWASKVLCKLQFNVEDLTSNGYLLPVSFNLDGSAAAERIIPPRSYSLSAKFSF